MDIRPIRTDADHIAALKKIDRLWGAKEGTPDGDNLDILITLVDAYEDRRWPAKKPKDPVEYIKLVMKTSERTQADLATLLGSRTRASEIMARKRALSIDHIRKLTDGWGLSAEVLVKPYRLAKEPAKKPRRSAETKAAAAKRRVA